MNSRVLATICILVIALSALAGSADDEATTGVYEYVVRQSSLDFDAASVALEKQIAEGPYELVAKLLQANPQTGPFAVPLRINLFEDEQGVHVGIVNPVNVNRTTLLDDAKYAPLAESARTSLRSLVTAAVPGQASAKPNGQMRKKGYIGRTMGVMAGGPFDGKIKLVAEVPGGEFAAVIEQLQQGINQGEGKWAFMKNMGMLGSIAEEMQERVGG